MEYRLRFVPKAMKNRVIFTKFRKEQELELLDLWRKSFHRAVGIEEDTRPEVLREHLEFLQSLDPIFIRVAVEKDSGKIVGFMRMEGNVIKDLFIHVDYQRQGLGSRFIRQAKEENEFLSLSTYVLNKGAQIFYEFHHFVITERGFASFGDNPWATNKQQLAEITYEWRKR